MRTFESLGGVAMTAPRGAVEIAAGQVTVCTRPESPAVAAVPRGNELLPFLQVRLLLP